MSDDDTEMSARQTEALGRRPLGRGRLGTYTLLGGASGIVPLPWVPDAIAKRVRGALVHDLCARRGLSITPEARTILIETAGSDGPKSLLAQGVTFAVFRVLARFGPLALVSPIRSAIGTFVLGHLLQRYLETARTSRTVRIDVEEARRLRRAIDQALLYALTTEPRDAGDDAPHAPEDLRDQTTQVVDGAIIGVANLPGWLVRRLDAAFDDVILSSRG
jgi:hypothetical protein